MAGQVKELKKGDILFRENDPSDCLYVIKKGRIAVTKAKGSGEIELALDYIEKNSLRGPGPYWSEDVPVYRTYARDEANDPERNTHGDDEGGADARGANPVRREGLCGNRNA